MTKTFRNTILNGDCTVTMREFERESVDFILTDPPYITRYRDRNGRTVSNDDNANWSSLLFVRCTVFSSLAVSVSASTDGTRLTCLLTPGARRVSVWWGTLFFASVMLRRRAFYGMNMSKPICWRRET